MRGSSGFSVTQPGSRSYSFCSPGLTRSRSWCKSWASARAGYPITWPACDGAMSRSPSAAAAASSIRSPTHGFAACLTWHPNLYRMIRSRRRTIAASDLTGSDPAPAGSRHDRMRRKPPPQGRGRSAHATHWLPSAASGSLNVPRPSAAFGAGPGLSRCSWPPLGAHICRLPGRLGRSGHM